MNFLKKLYAMSTVQYLVKNAVNAALLSLVQMYHDPQDNNFHDWHGVKGILWQCGAAVLAREGMIVIPKIIKWSTTNGGTMKVLLALALSLTFVSTVKAQQPFSLTASPVAIPAGSGQAKQTVAAAITGMTLTVTNNFDLRNDDVVTSDGNLQGYYGGFNYRLPVLSTALNNMSSTLNGYNFQFYLTGSVGQDYVSKNSHWSFLAGVGCNYKMTSSGSLTMGFEARYAKFPGYSNNTALISLGPTFHF